MVLHTGKGLLGEFPSRKTTKRRRRSKTVASDTGVSYDRTTLTQCSIGLSTLVAVGAVYYYLAASR